MGLLKFNDTSLQSSLVELASVSACSCVVPGGEFEVVMHARLWDSRIALAGIVVDGGSWFSGLM